MNNNQMFAAKCINTRGMKCWCPICKKENQKIGGGGVWGSPEGLLVCHYASCKKCWERVENTPALLQPSLMDQMERNLLERFPELYEKLPPGYTPGVDGTLNGSN